MPILRAPRVAAAALLLILTGASAQPAFVPAYQEDFPDPVVLEHKGEYLAYATNSDVNVPMARSTNLVRWEAVHAAGNPKQRHDAMPVLGAWARKGLTWAPEVIEVGGRWLLYYTARDRKRNLQCIGAASASDPRGPFRDTADQPFVCQTELGGTIDADAFLDSDGGLFLYYKNDGNAVRKPTHIWAQRLSPDGLKLVGEAVPLLRNDKAWERHAIEAPSMIRSPKGGYVMFFSANHFGWEKDQRLSAYAMGYATCRGPMGPCEDAPENPILYSYNDRRAGCLSGPGHQDIFQAGGRMFIAFHAWAATAGCRPAKQERHLYVAPLSWKDGKPQIGPSLRPVEP